MNYVRLKIITPAKVFADIDVETIVMPGEQGDFAIMSGHEQYVMALRSGKITTYHDNKISHVFLISSGVAEISGEMCTVLVDSITVEDDGFSADIKKTEGRLHKVRQRAVEHK